MKRLIVVVLLGFLAWQGYAKFESGRVEAAVAHDVDAPAAEVASPVQFKCDGRTHCSQMTSCDEATFFLANCPAVKMDGNNDGVPCEKQWC